MRDLDGEPAACTGRKTAHDPGTGDNKTDGSRRIRTQAPYHSSVDVLHLHGSRLSQDRRKAQQQSKFHLLGPAHLLTAAEPVKEDVFLPFHQISRNGYKYITKK